MTTTTQRRRVRRLIQSKLDEYGTLCTLQREIPLCDAIADAVITELKPKRKPRTPAQVKSAELYHVARALAGVCVMNYEANKGRLFSEAKQLAKATPRPTAALIKQHYGKGGSWYTKDWRGREEREPPTTGQVRSTWARLVGKEEPPSARQGVLEYGSDEWYEQQMAQDVQAEAFR